MNVCPRVVPTDRNAYLTHKLVSVITSLRRRFQFMGLATLLFSPLISIYLILYFFFRYFEVSIAFIDLQPHLLPFRATNSSPHRHLGCFLCHVGVSQEPEFDRNEAVHTNR